MAGARREAMAAAAPSEQGATVRPYASDVIVERERAPWTGPRAGHDPLVVARGHVPTVDGSSAGRGPRGCRSRPWRGRGFRWLRTGAMPWRRGGGAARGQLRVKGGGLVVEVDGQGLEIVASAKGTEAESGIVDV
jgi:hypothetical protein